MPELKDMLWTDKQNMVGIFNPKYYNKITEEIGGIYKEIPYIPLRMYGHTHSWSYPIEHLSDVMEQMDLEGFLRGKTHIATDLATPRPLIIINKTLGLGLIIAPRLDQEELDAD